MPAGIFDALGFLKGQSIYLELKCAKPAFKNLRPSQQQFLIDLDRQGLVGWSCFAHRDQIMFHRGLDFETLYAAPFFYARSP